MIRLHASCAHVALGRRHVIKELRVARHKAVMKGMDWLARFLTKDGHAALYAIGDDAPSVFFEIWCRGGAGVIAAGR